MIKVLVVSISGEQTIQQVKGLEDAQKIVGGYIEIIQLNSCDVYFNEEGIAKELSPNKFISEFLIRELAKEDRVMLTQSGFVLGTAFVTGKTKNGEWCDVPFKKLPLV